ncbi:MAG: hypothetical protein PHD95_03175 [Candidatus ainarchaeum sp.]|nr:hypothetical protein [Candidatus ainarchaeum sp.]
MVRNRKIRIMGDHARIRSLSKKEQRTLRFGTPRLVERTSRCKPNPAYSAAMTLAYLLFPNYFPRQIASGINKKTTFSEAIPVNSTTQKGIRAFYSNRLAAWENPHFLKHANSTNSVVPIIYKLVESGLIVNENVMNIGITPTGRPVFFELKDINLPRLRETIMRLPTGKRRERARSLFASLKKIARKKTFLRVHED